MFDLCFSQIKWTHLSNSTTTRRQHQMKWAAKLQKWRINSTIYFADDSFIQIYRYAPNQRINWYVSNQKMKIWLTASHRLCVCMHTCVSMYVCVCYRYILFILCHIIIKPSQFCINSITIYKWLDHYQLTFFVRNWSQPKTIGQMSTTQSLLIRSS